MYFTNCTVDKMEIENNDNLELTIIDSQNSEIIAINQTINLEFLEEKYYYQGTLIRSQIGCQKSSNKLYFEMKNFVFNVNFDFKDIRVFELINSCIDVTIYP